MTKQRAIKILQEFIKHKKRCTIVLGDDQFENEQLEHIRDTLKRLAKSDQETLEMILKELERKNDSERKKKLP